MFLEERDQLLERLKDKEFRDGLVEADVANGILFQLQAMLEDRDWKQEDLAAVTHTAQPVISKYLNGYENFNIKTLKKLASAFDVSLKCRFEPFSELVNRVLNLQRDDLAVKGYGEDTGLSKQVFATTASVPFVSGNTATVTVTYDSLFGNGIAKAESYRDLLGGLVAPNPMPEREDTRLPAFAGGEDFGIARAA